MNKYTVKIVADTNDGDYVTKLTDITLEELLLIEAVAQVVREHGNAWKNQQQGDPIDQYGGRLAEEDIEDFDGYVPYDEYGVHTIVSIEFTPIINWEKIL